MARMKNHVFSWGNLLDELKLSSIAVLGSNVIVQLRLAIFVPFFTNLARTALVSTLLEGII